MCCNTRKRTNSCDFTSEIMSKKKGKTNIKLDLLCKCNKAHKKLCKAKNSGDAKKIAEAKNHKKSICSKLKTKK